MTPYEQDDIGFDLEIAKNSIDAYSRSTGVGSIIINTYGKTLHSSVPNCSCYDFCKRVQMSNAGLETCSRSHLYGSYQAERFGGIYVFFCPMGMVHWASPIMDKGSVAGSLLGGPILMVEPEEFLIHELISEGPIKDICEEEVMSLTQRIPIVKPDVVKSLSELLRIVASHISGAESRSFFEGEKVHELQSVISGYIHDIKTSCAEEKNITGYPIEKEKELLSLISLGNKAGAQELLNEILGHIYFSTGGNFEVIKARVLELIVLLSRAAMEGGADVEQIFGLNYNYLSQINSFKTLEELSYWLSKIMTRFTDCVFNLVGVKHIDIIYKAIDYIKRNYAEKITLEDVADYVHLSPSYFSKVFKEELKCNFTVYLNRVRVDLSKKLLMDKSIPLIDISGLVGFEDQSYFCKVFKRATGISPGKFRESRGNMKTVST